MIQILQLLFSLFFTTAAASSFPCWEELPDSVITYSGLQPSDAAYLACDTSHSGTFCVQSASTGGYGRMVLNDVWVVRQVKVSAVPDVTGVALPSSVRLEQETSATSSTPYVTAGDKASGQSWTLVNSDSALTGDFLGSTFRLYPTAVDQTTPLGMAVKVIGCSALKTESVKLTFPGASKSSVVSRYTSVQEFMKDANRHLCKLTFLSDSCSRIVMGEFSEAKNSETGKSEVTVTARILPPVQGCAEASVQCYDASTVTNELSSALKDTTSTAYNVIKTLEVSIADVQPYLCANKVCGASEMCINGMCMSGDDLSTSGQAADGGSSSGGGYFKQVTSIQALALDGTLNAMSPLALIAGVEPSKDPLTFQQQQKALNSDYEVVMAPKDSGSVSVKALAVVVGLIVAAGLVWFFFF